MHEHEGIMIEEAKIKDEACDEKQAPKRDKQRSAVVGCVLEVVDIIVSLGNMAD